jgi:hypothetical protein
VNRWAAANVAAFPANRERRRGKRFPYPALVRVDRQSGAGLDISTSGVAVLLPEPLPVGHIVVVALGGGADLRSRARVARVAPTSHGVIVGLQFVD